MSATRGHHSYGSVPNADGTVEEAPAIGSSLSLSSSAGTKLSRKFVYVSLAACFVLASVVFLSNIMTEDEREIAHWNGLSSSWFPAQNIRKAQKIADKSRASFLGDHVFQHFRVLNDDDVVELDDADDPAGTDDASNENQKIIDGQQGDNDKQRHEKNKQKKSKGSLAVGCEATIVIIRHCEKGQVREHCAYVGYERSVFLATLFGDEQERWPAPSRIYALGPGGRHDQKKLNFREIETVGALSAKVQVPVDYSYRVKSSNSLGKDLLRLVHSGEVCGKVIVVSWKHSNIPHLAHHLGCGPAQGCPVDYRGKEFDQAWQLKYVYSEFGHSVQKNLKLPSSPEWKVFGSVQREDFDPLAFSKLAGDYPPGGSVAGGSWKAQVGDVPERQSRKDTDDWVQATNVNLLASSHN